MYQFQSIRQNRAIFVAVALCMASTVAEASGQMDPCSAIASLGWPADVAAADIGYEQWRRAVRFYKYDSSSTYSSSLSGGVSTVIPVEAVLVPLNFSASSSGFEAFRRSSTDYTQREFFDRFRESQRYQRINSDALEVVAECVRRPGFYAYLSQSEDSPEFGLLLRYKIIPGIEAISVSVQPGSGVECKERTVMLSASGTNVRALSCTRPDEDTRTRRVLFNLDRSEPITSEVLIPPPTRVAPASGEVTRPEYQHFRFSFPRASPMSPNQLVLVEMRFEWDGEWQPNALTSCSEGTVGGIRAQVRPSNPDTDCVSGGWAAWKALDGSPAHGNGWLVQNSFPATLTLSLAEPKQLTQYAIRVSNCTGRHAPYTWEVHASNDLRSWRLLHAENNQVGWRHVERVCNAQLGEERFFRLPELSVGGGN